MGNIILLYLTTLMIMYDVLHPSRLPSTILEYSDNWRGHRTTLRDVYAEFADRTTCWS